MSIRCRLALGFLLSVLVLHRPATAQTAPAVARWIPSDALVAVHLSQPKALLDLLTGERMTEAVTSLPQFAQQMAQPKMQEFLNIVRFVETSLNTDWRTGLRQLTGTGVTLALCPDDKVLVIIEAEDRQLLEQLHGLFLTFAQGEAQKQGRAAIASKPYAGATV